MMAGVTSYASPLTRRTPVQGNRISSWTRKGTGVERHFFFVDILNRRSLELVLR